MPEPTPLLTATEIAKLFRVSEPTVYRWARSGDLESITIGGTIRFRRTDVEALLASDGAA